MQIRPYDKDLSACEIKNRDDFLWKKVEEFFLKDAPKKFYKYRDCNKENFDALQKDYAWFSKTCDFGDLLDFTINCDIEKEMAEFKNNPKPQIRKIALTLLNASLSKYKVSIDENTLEPFMSCFNENGEISETDVSNFLNDNYPTYATKDNAKQIVDSSHLKNEELIYGALRESFETYLGFNNNLRANTYAFCMTEDSDNQIMWETYAKGDTGFCIEYKFPLDTLLSQRMITNLFPIYYGEKELVKFFDVLLRGLSSEKNINCVADEDYERWFVSSYTKDPSYLAQKEWRIVFWKKWEEINNIFLLRLLLF